ncbi:MAG TPA: response regulator [Geobacteraceae bacterium]|nr:response regulator [Geobacteraceae bacterium]
MRMNNILLVDDNENYLDLLSIFLESKGFDVTITANAAKALEILDKARFRMIITDFHMQGINGIKLAMKVRRQYPDIHIVMITGDDSPDIVEAAVNAGVSHILFKPVNLTDLLEITQSSLSFEQGVGDVCVI